MSGPVTVQMWPSLDGKLHSSEAAASAHDTFIGRLHLVTAVAEIVSEATWGGQLSGFCGSQHAYEHDDSSYERDRRNEHIAELIIDRWADLAAVIQSFRPAA